MQIKCKLSDLDVQICLVLKLFTKKVHYPSLLQLPLCEGIKQTGSENRPAFKDRLA
jgi:hypothetical protein